MVANEPESVCVWGRLAVTTAVVTTAMERAVGFGVVLAAHVMTCVAYMATPNPRFVALKMIERRCAALWQWSGIAVMRIIAVIDVAVEAVRSVKPWTRSDEQTASEPIRPIVTVGSAIIRNIVEVSVRAYRWNTDGNGDLGWCFRAASEQESRRQV